MPQKECVAAMVYPGQPLVYDKLVQAGFIVEVKDLSPLLRHWYRHIWDNTPDCGRTHHYLCPYFNNPPPVSLKRRAAFVPEQNRKCPVSSCNIHIGTRWYDCQTHLKLIHFTDELFLCGWDGCGMAQYQKNSAVDHFSTHIAPDRLAMSKNWCYLHVREASGRVRLCDFRTNDASWLERHRRESDGGTRHLTAEECGGQWSLSFTPDALSLQANKDPSNIPDDMHLVKTPGNSCPRKEVLDAPVQNTVAASTPRPQACLHDLQRHHIGDHKPSTPLAIVHARAPSVEPTVVPQLPLEQRSAAPSPEPEEIDLDTVISSAPLPHWLRPLQRLPVYQDGLTGAFTLPKDVRNRFSYH